MPKFDSITVLGVNPLKSHLGINAIEEGDDLNPENWIVWKLIFPRWDPVAGRRGEP
jgi:hypothetical protein